MVAGGATNFDRGAENENEKLDFKKWLFEVKLSIMRWISISFQLYTV
jgi:hypothetical protein